MSWGKSSECSGIRSGVGAARAPGSEPLAGCLCFPEGQGEKRAGFAKSLICPLLRAGQISGGLLWRLLPVCSLRLEMGVVFFLLAFYHLCCKLLG